MFAHLILMVLRRELALYLPANKEKISLFVNRLIFTGPLNCLKLSLLLGEVKPTFLMGPQTCGDKNYCYGSVLRIRGNLG